MNIYTCKHKVMTKDTFAMITKSYEVFFSCRKLKGRDGVVLSTDDYFYRNQR